MKCITNYHRSMLKYTLKNRSAVYTQLNGVGKSLNITVLKWSFCYFLLVLCLSNKSKTKSISSTSSCDGRLKFISCGQFRKEQLLQQQFLDPFLCVFLSKCILSQLLNIKCIRFQNMLPTFQNIFRKFKFLLCKTAFFIHCTTLSNEI